MSAGRKITISPYGQFLTIHPLANYTGRALQCRHLEIIKWLRGTRQAYIGTTAEHEHYVSDRPRGSVHDPIRLSLYSLAGPLIFGDATECRL